MKFLILGDVHACWTDLNVTIARAIREHPDITHIVQVGDLGYGNWGGGEKPFKASRSYMSEEEMEVYQRAEKLWLDGNHENFDQLEADGGSWMPDWTHMPRGSVLEVDGYRMMFFGGATSSDKHMRTEGQSWWRQENITYAQVMNTLEKVDGKLDAIFSHEHPSSVPYSESRYNSHIIGKTEKDSLQALKDKYLPDFWFFGHHHAPDRGEVDGTSWFCCPIIESRWYTIWTGTSVETQWDRKTKRNVFSW